MKRYIIEHIINKMLKKQNEWTDLFLGDINVNYNAIVEQNKIDGTRVMVCGWYYFTVKNGKTRFHIAKCA